MLLVDAYLSTVIASILLEVYQYDLNAANIPGSRIALNDNGGTTVRCESGYLLGSTFQCRLHNPAYHPRSL